MQRSLELHASLNKRYEELLNKQGIQIDRLTKLPTPEPVNIENQEKKISEQLSKLGIYALNNGKLNKDQHVDNQINHAFVRAS